MIINGERLIDVNGDGIPDNVDIIGSGSRTQIDMDGDGKPEMDIDGDKILDSDFNGDGFPDEIVIDTTTLQAVVFIRYRATDGTIKKVPVAEAGFVKVTWSNDASQLYVAWNQQSTATRPLSLANTVVDLKKPLLRIAMTPTVTRIIIISVLLNRLYMRLRAILFNRK